MTPSALMYSPQVNEIPPQKTRPYYTTDLQFPD